MKKLAEDCCKYGNDNQHFGFALARASEEFGKSHKQIEKEREDLLKSLGEQVMKNFHLLIEFLGLWMLFNPWSSLDHLSWYIFDVNFSLLALLTILQVFEPLREMIMSAPLEDARLLTYRYQRIRQDMESQVTNHKNYFFSLQRLVAATNCELFY